MRYGASRTFAQSLHRNMASMVWRVPVSMSAPVRIEVVFRFIACMATTLRRQRNSWKPDAQGALMLAKRMLDKSC